MTRRRRRLAIQLALALATLAVYAQVAGHDFVNYDDDRWLSDNPVVREGLHWDGLVWAVTEPHMGNWSPLAGLSHMLDVELFGLAPGGHHATNVVLHLLATLLLFQFFERATGAAGRSAFVAGVFALHPLHVESVAWVSERRDVLSTVFWMLALCAHLGYARRPGALRFALVALAVAAGLASKAMVVTLPVVLLLLDYWPLRRFGTPLPGLPARLAARCGLPEGFALVIEKLPLLALALLASVGAVMAQQAGEAVSGVDLLPIGVRLANAIVAACAYVGLSFWPANLGVLYPHPGPWLASWQVAASALFLLGVSVAVLRGARRFPFLPVGWFWYLGTLLPVIGLVQVGAQGMADRYTYVPLVGLSLLVAWGVPAWLGEGRHRRALAAVAVSALLALSFASFRQARHWRDSVALFEQAIAAVRASWLPFPDSPILHYNLGIGYASRGRAQEAEREYRRTLALGEDNAALRSNLANALVLQGREEEALAHYERALALDPGHLNAHFNYGAVLVGLGRFAQAEPHTARYLRERPEEVPARMRLAEALLAQGQGAAAARIYREVLALGPDAPLALAPDALVAANNLAWLLATSSDPALRDPREALLWGRRVGEADADDPGLLDTLAAALAAAGRFPEAVDTARRAAELAEQQGNPALAAAIRQRLAGYASGRPHVDAPGEPGSRR